MSYTFTRTGAQIEEIHNTVDDLSNIVSNENLILNSSFEIAGSVTSPPDATPRSYNAGDEIFQGMFAVGALTGVTYIDGKSNGTGQLYTDVYKSEKQKLSTANYVASIASSDGSPVESGASFVDIGDYWRVTFDMNETFSVKFERGSIATSHEICQLKLAKFGSSVSFKIPSDFPDFMDAIEATQFSMSGSSSSIILIAESGHKIKRGIDVRWFDASRYIIQSEDAILTLDPSFVGVDASDLLPGYAGIIGEIPRPPLFFGLYSRLPTLDCVIDMGGLYGCGVQCAESWFSGSQGSGVINSGFRAYQIHGRANLYGMTGEGADGSSLRIQQASSVNARNFIGDMSCKNVNSSDDSAIYQSRSSTLEFRGGSANDSGAAGYIGRRCLATLDDATFDRPADKAVIGESESNISWANGSGVDCVSNAIRCISNASVYAVGASTSTTSSADNFNVDSGGVITIAGSNTIEGASGSESLVISESNVEYTNAFGDSGMIFFDGGNGTFKLTSNSNGVSQRFADGTMRTFISTTIDTGQVLANAYSQQISLPTQPDTFATVRSVSFDVVGRTGASGGGNRLFVSECHRPQLTTGSEWKVYNTGVQLDGTSTGLICLSINATIVTEGTWR
jgi:hypothetical protein